MADSINVLMVDDEIVVLEAFVDILEDEGYKMFTADCGEKAMEVARAHSIDIVVTDINMPGMDGLELLSAIHEMDPEIPVIMATAYSSIENTVESMRRGASNYLIKPIKVELLRSVLAEAAAKRRMLHKNRELTGGLKKSNESLKALNAERKRVLEVIAQNLRQPLIDQMNWCELLMTDTEHSLYGEHLATIAKVNSAASGMFAEVQELLDGDKLEDKCEDLIGTDAPLEQAAPAEPAPPAEVAEADSQDVVPPRESLLDFRVLVVEHAPILRDVLVGALRRKFRVFSAADGWQALHLLVERPHLILTELDLPRVDTGELLRHARKMIDNVAVAVMHDPKDMARLAAIKPLGVQETIRKPFRIEDVLGKVEALAETTVSEMNESVLLVCPYPQEQDALYDLLASRYRTCIAPSAEAALAETANGFDLVILDTTDESHSWMDDVRLFREHREEIKVLALADGKDDVVANAIREVEIDSAVVKPYAFDDLLSRVRGLLGVEEIEGRVLRSVFRRPML